jgi:enolase
MACISGVQGYTRINFSSTLELNPVVGFAPNLESIFSALERIVSAICSARTHVNKNISFGVHSVS